MLSSNPPLSPDALPARERWWVLGLVVILVFLAVHFARGLNRPWSEEDNWYGAVYSQAAHNNLRAGMRAGGVPATLYFGPLPIPPEAYYVHHPTLLPVLVTVSFAMFGEAEWSARLVPILASLGSVIVLWLFLRGTAGPRAATLGAAIFALVPMELHYGDMVDFEPVLTFWMLALLACLWRWEVTRRRMWAAGAIVFAALALWTDWPGYLLVLSAAVWLIFFAPREGGCSRGAVSASSRPRARRGALPPRPGGAGRLQQPTLRLGLLFLTLVGCAGLLFLCQIRSVNASAWNDLWSALQMRLGSAIPTSTAPIADNAPRFTGSDWLRTIVDDLRGNFLDLTWLFVGVGIVRLFRERRNEALCWPCLAAVLLTIAGLLYVVLLRNESFIHDFAPFYLIGAVAILGGLGLDAICQLAEYLPRTGRLAIHVPVVLFVTLLAGQGLHRAEELRSPYLILDGVVKEPANLIPDLGKVLKHAFPENATILANFDSYGSALTYYAQRPILTNLLTPEDWRIMRMRETPAGGVIWLGAKNASEILATLPDDTERIEVAGFVFALWRSASRAISSRLDGSVLSASAEKPVILSARKEPKRLTEVEGPPIFASAAWLRKSASRIGHLESKCSAREPPKI